MIRGYIYRDPSFYFSVSGKGIGCLLQLRRKMGLPGSVNLK
jgi:hypothetical protein